jgi:hypothetical protein
MLANSPLGRHAAHLLAGELDTARSARSGRLLKPRELVDVEGTNPRSHPPHSGHIVQVLQASLPQSRDMADTPKGPVAGGHPAPRAESISSHVVARSCLAPLSNCRHYNAQKGIFFLETAIATPLNKR